MLAASFFKVGTWVFLLVPFALFFTFYACTTAKKLFVKIPMGCNARTERRIHMMGLHRQGPSQCRLHEETIDLLEGKMAVLISFTISLIGFSWIFLTYRQHPF